MKRFILVLGIMTSLLFLACSVPKFQARREVSSLSLESFIPLEPKVDKAITDPVSGTVYALSRAQQMIFIYKERALVNSIGGLGSQNYNFQRLTDIGLDSDGSLLALDQMAKTIKKFSPSGRYIASFELHGLKQPELFCMSMDRELFIYDAAPSEIVNISILDGKELYRFGRFQLGACTSLSCNRELISVYSSDENQSKLFDSLSQHIQDAPGQVLPDIYGNLLLINSQISSLSQASLQNVELQEAKLLLPILEPGQVTIYQDRLTHSCAWGVNIFKISYQILQP